jgi:hypothetical protein
LGGFKVLNSTTAEKALASGETTPDAGACAAGSAATGRRRERQVGGSPGRVAAVPQCPARVVSTPRPQGRRERTAAGAGICRAHAH